MNSKPDAFKFAGLIFRFLSIIVLFGFLADYTVWYLYIFSPDFILDPGNSFMSFPLLLLVFVALLPLLITAVLAIPGHTPATKRSYSSNQTVTYLVAAGLALYLSATLLLFLFRLQTDTALDPSFLFLNISGVLPTASILAVAIPIPVFIAMVTFIIICLWNGFRFILQVAAASPWLHRRLTRVIIFGMIASHLLAPNELVAFSRQFYQEFLVANKN